MLSSKVFISIIISMILIQSVKSETRDNSISYEDLTNEEMAKSINESLNDYTNEIKKELKENLETKTNEIKQELKESFMKIFETESSLKNKTDEIKLEMKETFTNFMQCDKELKNLQIEIQNLKTQLNNNSNYDENFNCIKNCRPFYYDCEEAMKSTSSKGGIFLLKTSRFGSIKNSFYAYCERINNIVWTVIQRREDGSVDFNRNWESYKNGFGNLYGEFWIGLQRLYDLQKNHGYELYIRMTSTIGEERYAKYKKFSIADEKEKYKLTIGEYSGNAGDSLSPHNNMKFSTFDNCNDHHAEGKNSCSESYKGGWWFNNCYNSHLNGRFNPTDILNKKGICWNAFAENLRFSEILIRPTSTFAVL